MRDELDRRKYPRMPWHDVHCALWGPPCRDVARHFVQRWNHAKVNLWLVNIFFMCQSNSLYNIMKHLFRETKLQMNKQFHCLCLTTAWSFLITWEEAER
jgi:hypothetical protein